jgi:ParB family chromosome partitioning protein
MGNIINPAPSRPTIASPSRNLPNRQRYTGAAIDTNQPRRYFDPVALQKLAQSIAQYGILEPLIVRPIAGNRYELVAGERRYRAASQA